MSVGAVVWAVLAVASGVSVAVGQPWTTRVSRRRYPPELWTDPIFVDTNRLITVGWTVYFAVAAGVSAVGPGWVSIGFGVLSWALSPLSFRFGESYSANRASRPTVVSAAPALSGCDADGSTP